MYMAVCPFACRCIGTEEQHGGGGGCNKDERDNEGDTPGDMRRETSTLHERVEDGRHDKVGNASTCIAETPGERVGCSDYVLVEETC